MSKYTIQNAESWKACQRQLNQFIELFDNMLTSAGRGDEHGVDHELLKSPQVASIPWQCEI